MSDLLVQICPPGTGGVRDYADSLGRAWATRGVASQVIEGTREGLLPQLHALRSTLPASAGLRVVLHFSGYGYAARGLCGWLADDLAAFKAIQGGGVRLLVVFHELFAADAPIWRSGFWLARWQSDVARRIARLADSLWTNATLHADWLRSVVHPLPPLQVRPVFSNVGEPSAPTPWADRTPRAVVFGSASTRRRALQALADSAPTLRALGIDAIVEAGDGDTAIDGELGIPVRRLGRQSVADLSALLSASRFGLIEYPAEYLGKSGVFAGYAANGCAVLNVSPRRGDHDGLRDGVHYLSVRAPAPAHAEAPEQMAGRLRQWYADHSLALQAQEFLEATGVLREGQPARPVAAC